MRRQLETAEQIVEALGHMKGAAMKLGQVMSFLDVGLVPEPFREEFQEKLGRLRDAAPKVSFRDMRRVLEARVRREAVDASSTTSTRTRSPPPRSARSTAPACRRARSGGEGPVPRGQPGRPGRHAEPGDHPAAHEAGGARPRRAGARPRDPRADRRGARLRARGAEPAGAGPHLPRPPVHRRARGADRALARARHRQRLRRGPRLRGAQAAPAGRARPPGRDHLPLLLRLHVPPPPVQRRPAPGQLAAARRRADGLPGLRALQADPAEVAELELRVQRLGIEHRADELLENLRDAGFLAGTRHTPEGVLEQFLDTPGGTRRTPRCR